MMSQATPQTLARHCWLLALLPLLFANSQAARAQVDLDAIVAVVNNDVVLYSELNSAGNKVVRSLQQQGTPIPPQAVLVRQVLERLIVQRLQLQRARETGIRVDDRTLNLAISNIAKGNKLGLTEFRRILLAEGYDYGAFREEVRDKITLERLIQREVSDRIRVSDQEIDDYLSSQRAIGVNNREVKLAHILIGVPEAASTAQIAKAKAEATRLRQQALNGANFAELAVAHSSGSEALDGGDLGWRPIGSLPGGFVQVIAALGSGDISQPIRSPAGFHLFKVEAVRGEQRRIVEQTHVRHILIRVDEKTSADQARRTLDRLRIRITGGENFEAIARARSDDTGSAPRGGDLGWVNPGDLVPQFEQTMNKLDPGQVSQPFASPFGMHLAQVLERRSQDNTDQFQRNQAREAITERKAEEDEDNWLRRLRDEAYVDIRLDEEA